MQPCIKRLNRVMLGPKVFGHGQYSGEEVEAAKTAFYDDILRRINKMLAGQQRYLIARNEPTAVDIIFYNEVSTALMMSRIKGFKREYPHIDKWIGLMGEI